MSDTSSYVPVPDAYVNAVKGYIRDELHIRSFKENKEISSDVGWRPSLQVVHNKYTTIAYEINEKVLPPILLISRMEIVNTNQPICVYSVCPESEYINNKPEFNALKSHGFGLLTIDDSGVVTEQAHAIPLVQFIPKTKYNDMVNGLPNKIKERVRDAFEVYNTNAVAGLAEITRIIEGLTFSAAKKLVNINVLPVYHGSISLANLLNHMQITATQKQSLAGLRAPIGGFQSHVKSFRNPAHHEPKNKKEAKKLLSTCESGFNEGVRKISDFVAAFKNQGIILRI